MGKVGTTFGFTIENAVSTRPDIDFDAYTCNLSPLVKWNILYSVILNFTLSFVTIFWTACQSVLCSHGSWVQSLQPSRTLNRSLHANLCTFLRCFLRCLYVSPSSGVRSMIRTTAQLLDLGCCCNKTVLSTSWLRRLQWNWVTFR